MNTELDRDDALGQRIAALRSWQTVTVDDHTWRLVESRRRRDRTQHVVVGALVFAALIGTLAVVANLATPSRRHVSVVEPTPTPTPAPRAVPVLEPAPLGAMPISPPGPYVAGQSVQVSITATPDFRAEDPANEGLAVCYPWAEGETCDPTIEARYLRTDADGTAVFELDLPGWVYTPTGLQACETVHCRIEYPAGDGARIGSPTLDIASGAKPVVPARLNGIHRDEALVSIALDAVEPDPSWTRWSERVTPEAVAEFPPGWTSVCAFAAHLRCDALVQTDPPALDGRPHDVAISTNRLLLTPDGWTDCVKVVCVIAFSKAVGVEGNGQTVGSSGAFFALVPYSLPATTPEMPRPTLTVQPTGPVRIGDTVTVTLHDPPPNVDKTRLSVLNCPAGVELRVGGCSGHLANPWTTLADGSLQQRVPVLSRDPAGNYLAIDPAAKGWPEVARTEVFTILD